MLVGLAFAADKGGADDGLAARVDAGELHGEDGRKGLGKG